MGYKSIPEEIRSKAENILREVKLTVEHPEPLKIERKGSKTPRGDDNWQRSLEPEVIENTVKVFRTGVPDDGKHPVFTPGEYESGHLTVDFYNISDKDMVIKLVSMLKGTKGVSLSGPLSGADHMVIPG